MDNKPLIYQLTNLEDAQEFLKNYINPVILTNNQGSIRYYGVLILDYMFQKLIKEFPQIIKIIINVEDDHAALFTAIELNYKNIIYTGNSEEAKAILYMQS